MTRGLAQWGLGAGVLRGRDTGGEGSPIWQERQRGESVGGFGVSLFTFSLLSSILVFFHALANSNLALGNVEKARER